MRVPLSWLRTLCDPGLPAGELAERLAMTGTEVERVEHRGVGSPQGFVVGRVLEAERHPNADRLSVCQVDDGSGSPRTIVCGAPNVRGGQTVAVARPGAQLPDGRTLGEAKLRGVVSSGMILAEDEAGVGEEHAGIMVLADDQVLGDGLRPGAPLVEVLPISDDVLELEITPNRPDCLAVYGVAREVHAVTGAALAPDPTDADAEPGGDDEVADHVGLEVDPEICPRFTLRAFTDVRIGPSPLWLKAWLTAAGQRPISNVVDITNYVMLLTGQPLHAFDADRVRGGRLVVRRAAAGERLRTLDGVERVLDAQMAVITDAEGPTSLAGIMGGEVSEVAPETTRVLMEAATWVGPNILRTSSRLGLRSEASGRFEKGLHPEAAIAAQRLAARLMVELCGARLVPGTLDRYPRPWPQRVVRLRNARVRALLGIEVPPEESTAILDRLGFDVAEAEGALDVTVPSFRDGDVQREADLVEEVARVYGLERLPVTLPARRHAVGRLTAAQRGRRRLEDALRERGLSEIVTYSYTAPEALARLGLDPHDGVVRVANPLSEMGGVMRPLLLPGLLDAARRNAAHGRGGVALFESASVYAPRADRTPVAPAAPAGAPAADERRHLGGFLTEVAPSGWRSPAQGADFFAAKGVVEGTLRSVGLELSAEPGERPFLHPGRAARLLVDGRQVGWLGELHPRVAQAWDVEPGTAFELDADALLALAPDLPRFRDLTAFPAVRQDIAVVVDEAVPAARVVGAVRRGGGPLLRETRVFDLFRGEQVGPGRKSLAIALEFRAEDRTLREDEVAELRAAIERELAGVGGALRG